MKAIEICNGVWIKINAIVSVVSIASGIGDDSSVGCFIRVKGCAAPYYPDLYTYDTLLDKIGWKFKSLQD